MFIPKLPSFTVPQLACAVGSQMTLANGTAIAGLIETSFFYSLRGGIEEPIKCIKWIRETSIAYVHLIQNIFAKVNFAIILFSTKELVDEVANKFSISILTDKTAATIVKWVCAIINSALAVGIIDNYTQDESLNLNSPRTESFGGRECIITETFTHKQRFYQGLRICKLLTNIALACFMKNRLARAISLVSSIYCLWKETKLRVTTISTEKNNPLGPDEDIKKATVSYQILELPISNSRNEKNSDCPICLENETTAKIAFCANHIFCKKCIIEHIASNSEKFFEKSKYLSSTIHHYENSRFTYTSHEYIVEIPHNQLPTCPACRTIPSKNTCEFQIDDNTVNTCDTDVLVDQPPIDWQPVFETLYAIYNTFQAGLVYLQSYPELAVTILKIQKVMLLTDMIGFGITCHFFQKKFEEKYPLENSVPLTTIVMGGLISGFAGYLSVKFDQSIKSTINLKEILSQMNLSPELLMGTEVDWHTPKIQHFTRILYQIRILFTGALTLFSNNWKRNTLSIAMQLLSLTGVSRLKWIELTQTLSYPVQQIINNGGKFPSFFDKTSLRSLTLKTEFLVHPVTSIKSTLESILSCTQSFFNNSEWNRYWRIFYTNGIETERKIEYSIKLQNNPLTTYSGLFLPSLTDYKITLIDSHWFYREALALVKY